MRLIAMRRPFRSLVSSQTACGRRPGRKARSLLCKSGRAGGKRALKNIQESAWWSKHLTDKMWRYSLAATLTAITGSLVVILLSLNTINNYDILSGTGRVVTSVLMLVLSLGLSA